MLFLYGDYTTGKNSLTNPTGKKHDAFLAKVVELVGLSLGFQDPTAAPTKSQNTRSFARVSSSLTAQEPLYASK